MCGSGRKLLETSHRLASFPRPEKPITLYEFEGCPFCRKVRSLRRTCPIYGSPTVHACAITKDEASAARIQGSERNLCISGGQ